MLSYKTKSDTMVVYGGITAVKQLVVVRMVVHRLVSFSVLTACAYGFSLWNTRSQSSSSSRLLIAKGEQVSATSALAFARYVGGLKTLKRTGWVTAKSLFQKVWLITGEN